MPPRVSESTELNSLPTSEINQNGLHASTSSSASDVGSQVAPAKKRRVQWVGLSEDEPEQQTSGQSHHDPFDNPNDHDSPTPTPTPLNANAGSFPFRVPKAPTSGILSRRTPTRTLSLSMPETTLRHNPYFPPFQPDYTQASGGDQTPSANPDRPLIHSRADQIITPDASRPVTPDSDLDIVSSLILQPDGRPRTCCSASAH